ncbi:MAG: hypothetical protein PHV64_01605, partial [Bacteroidales bacterium]|nr:hypothetical protein [Bacteroidales bacterium]
NPDSMKVVHALIDAQAAESANRAVTGKDRTRTRIQFERSGYFVPDYDSEPGRPVFNRICTLKDSFSKTLNQP